jgi:hypothetical protein
MQGLGVPLEEGHGKLSRWLSFPFLWSGLVAARLGPSRAPSGRGDTGDTGGTPGGRCHTLVLDLVHLGSSLLQGLPVHAQWIDPSEKIAPTEGVKSTGQWWAWTEEVSGRGPSSDKVGSK